MKKLILISGIFLFLSCDNLRKDELPIDTIEQPTDLPTVPEEQLTLISGTIQEVKAEKDGQTISLTDQNGNEIKALISIPNLRENGEQYREFKKDDFIIFKGEYVSDERMVIRELVKP